MTRTDALATARPYMALLNETYPLDSTHEWVVSEPVEYVHAWYFTASYASRGETPAGSQEFFVGPRGHLLARGTGLIQSVGWGDELEVTLQRFDLRHRCERTAEAFLAQTWSLGALRRLCPQMPLPRVVELKHLLERAELSLAQRVALLQAVLVMAAGDVLTAQLDGFSGDLRRILQEIAFTVR